MENWKMCSIGSFFSLSLSLLDCNYIIVVVPTSDDFPRISFRSHQHQIISIIGIDLRYLCVLSVLAAISQYGRRNTERCRTAQRQATGKNSGSRLRCLFFYNCRTQTMRSNKIVCTEWRATNANRRNQKQATNWKLCRRYEPILAGESPRTCWFHIYQP